MIDPVKKSTDLSIPHITEWKITCKPTDAKDFIQV